MYSYTTQGTCSRQILIDIEGNIIKHVEFVYIWRNYRARWRTLR